MDITFFKKITRFRHRSLNKYKRGLRRRFVYKKAGYVFLRGRQNLVRQHFDPRLHCLAMYNRDIRRRVLVLSVEVVDLCQKYE